MPPRRNTRSAFREFAVPNSTTPARPSWEGTLRLTLPSPPGVNDWKTPLRLGGSVRVVKSRAFRAYERAVRAAFTAQAPGVGPAEGPLGLVVRWYRPRRVGDLDGRLKSLCDSLNGLAYVDDAQIEEIHANRYDDKDDPRAEVEIVRLWRPAD